MSQNYISERFLSALFEGHEASWQASQDKGWVLQVLRPEGGEEFLLKECTLTYGPEAEQIAIHQGTKTVTIFTRKWNSLHAEGGITEFRKDDVAYKFALRGPGE